MSRPVISFCIPTFNRVEFVTRCVKNILQYSGDDIEVVISNNGSNDDTLVELQKINDKRLKIFSNETNLGFSKNVLLAVERATGEFCFTMSDEDIIFVDQIPNLINLCKTTDKGVIYTVPKARTFDEKTQEYKDICVRYYVEKDRYEFEKLETINVVFIESYLTGYILRRDILPFDLINSDKCPEVSLYPHNFLNLLAFDKMGAEFLKDSFVELKWEADKSYIFDEKVVAGETYTHPLSRLVFMKCHIEWIKLLNLTELERVEVLFMVFRMALMKFGWTYTDSLDTGNGTVAQVLNNKVTKEECMKIAKDYIEKAEELKNNYENSNEFEKLILELSEEFKNKVVLV